MTAGEPAELLLRAVLLEDGPRAAEAGRGYFEAVDLQVIPWSQARLLPTLYKRMADVGEPTPPLLRGTYRKAWTQNQLRFRAVVPTIDALAAAGIPTLVLKGAALVPAYGGDWGVRDMSDVDLLVDRSQLQRAATIIDASGWRPTRDLTTAGVLARFESRRHSWNLEHPDGHQLDLHWRVFEDSRGPRSDHAFFEASVPLELGSVRVRRMCDADLLLHVLEHATHDEDASRLQWVVDAVKLLRAAPDTGALTARLVAQARAHALVEPVRARVEAITRVLDEPAVRHLLADLRGSSARPPAPQGTWRGRLGEHQRGGTPLMAASASLVKEVVDGPLADRRAAWLAYVASGRRPRVERLLAGRGGRLTTTPSTAVPDTDEDGWWQLGSGTVVEALCGPGFSFPEPGAGTWVDGPEGRLSVPVVERPPAGEPLVVELVVTVLGRFGGPAREVDVRAAGCMVAHLTADRGNAGHHLTIELPVPDGPTAELSIAVRDPARPIDLGIGPDRRHLGVMVHRVRVGGRRPAPSGDEPLQPTEGAGTVLVTGSCGQVGTALVGHLKATGWTVREFDLRIGDDLRDEQAVLAAARGCDAIVHAGAIPDDSAGSPADIVATNVVGTWHVLLAAERAGVSRVVYFSSIQVFGFSDHAAAPEYVPVDDDHPLLAWQPYGLSKRLAEEMCEAWTRQTGIATVVLRPVLILSDAGLQHYSEDKVELGAYVHLEDVVDASVRALDTKLDGHHRVTICGPGKVDTSSARDLLGWQATRGWGPA